MLRQLVAALALVASSAQAQEAPVPIETLGPTVGQRVVLVAGAIGGGWLTAVTFLPAAPTLTPLESGPPAPGLTLRVGL